MLVLCSSNLEKGDLYGACTLIAGEEKKLLLKTFVINPQFRNQGYGKMLLSKVEDLATELNSPHVQVTYRTYWNSNNTWEKMLVDRGWSEPIQGVHYVSMPDSNTQFEKDWFLNRVLPQEFGVETWNNSSFNQLQETLKKDEWKGLIRKSLDPFQMSELVLPHCSLLLKKGDEVVGWLICHLMQENVVQGTSLFVHPHKAKGTGLALMREAFRRRKLGARVVFVIEKDNEIMLNLVKKYITGGEVGLYQQLTRMKKIKS